MTDLASVLGALASELQAESEGVSRRQAALKSAAADERDRLVAPGDADPVLADLVVRALRGVEGGGSGGNGGGGGASGATVSATWSEAIDAAQAVMRDEEAAVEALAVAERERSTHVGSLGTRVESLRGGLFRHAATTTDPVLTLPALRAAVTSLEERLGALGAGMETILGDQAERRDQLRHGGPAAAFERALFTVFYSSPGTLATRFDEAISRVRARTVGR